MRNTGRAGGRGLADDRGDRTGGGGIRDSRADGVVDRGVSGPGGERRGVEEQPIAQRQPDDAPRAESSRVGSGAHQGLLFQGTVSTIDTATGGTQGGVGSGAPYRPLDLEGSARAGSLHRTGSASDGPDRDEAASGAAHQANVE